MTESKHTPGPWGWFGNANTNSIYLATTHSGRRFVMGFKRWGFRGAQPQFQPGNLGLIDASELLTFEVGDRDVRGVEQAKKNDSVYRLDIAGVDCADARLIAAAPDLLEALRPFAEIGIGTDSDYQPLIRMDREAIIRARAAIEKAEKITL